MNRTNNYLSVSPNSLLVNFTGSPQQHTGKYGKE